MKTVLAGLVSTATLSLTSAMPANATGWWFNSFFDHWLDKFDHGNTPGNVASVPEIDASSGLLALAAVMAVLAFAYERRRRAAL